VGGLAKSPPAGKSGARSAEEAEVTEKGERLIWLEDAMADRLGAMRKPGES
jgi:hypothetical protein